jgi:hypothetical protein
MTLSSPTSSIDLHWHLNPARSAFPGFDDLWARSVHVSVMGHAIPTLAPYDAMAHSASHSAKDGWRFIRGLLDIQLLASAQETWSTADRPLRHDQLLSIGLAARTFGVPSGAPAIVRDAVRLTTAVWPTALKAQAQGGPSHEVSRIPGERFFRVLRRLRWAGVDASDFVSLAAHTAMPPWATANETSVHASVVVPRVAVKRSAALARRARAATHRRA